MKTTISETAALLGVTTHMLRHYEKEGIIEPEVNPDNGYRYYTVLDTRRFNLSRILVSCGFSLEQCAALMGGAPVEEIEKACLEKEAELDFEIRRIQYAIRTLQRYRETLPLFDRDVGRIQVEHLPDMWRVDFSHIEKGMEDEALQEEKRRWLSCLPAVRWVSRIPFDVMKQFSSGLIEYDFGMMCYAESARDMGLQKTRFVEQVPGGDYVTMLHRKTDRGPWTWEDITPMTDYLKERNLTFFGDAFSYIVSSIKADGQVVNYHKLLVKVFT